MPLIPIDLKPGLYKNGTAYSGKLRWADSNLVRWKDGAIRVIGGWERRENSSGVNIAALFANATTEAPRNIITWTDNNGVAQIVVGTNKKLYHIDTSGLVTNISPSGFTGGSKDSGLNVGLNYGLPAHNIGTNIFLNVATRGASLETMEESLVGIDYSVYYGTPNIISGYTPEGQAIFVNKMQKTNFRSGFNNNYLQFEESSPSAIYYI